VSFQSQALDPARHNTAGFDSGEPALDIWLRDHAAGAQARRVATTFVWCRPDDDTVLAYYSLTGHVLQRDRLPKSIGRGSPDEVPAVLLARLALDHSLHGHGHGGELLLDALARVVVATSQVAARFVVVDALHDTAATFYEHHGFRRIPNTLRLVMKISDAAAAMTASQG
jgi:GNAT superfamily N-acetyltransferase